MNVKLFLVIGLIYPINFITANYSQKNILTNQFEKIALFYYDYYENFEASLINELSHTQTLPESYRKNILRSPLQSFSLVMNFNFNGNTELTFKGEDDKTYWQDQGICPHGYLYVPQVNACRELFCVEGFELTNEACIELENTNLTSKPDGLKLRLYISFIREYIPCQKSEYEEIDCDDTFIYKIMNHFNSLIDVSNDRFKDIKILQEDFVDFNANNYDWKLVNNTDDYKSKAQILKVEITVLEKSTNGNDEEKPLQIYFQLKALSQNNLIFEKEDHLFYLLDVLEKTEDTQKTWCESPGDIKRSGFKNGDFRIMVEMFNNIKKYSIYLNETEYLYETGYFVLGFLYEWTNKNIKRQESKPPRINGRNLTDVTDILLSDDKKNSSQFLIVCDRAPKIRRDLCKSHITIRVNKCEFNFYPSTRKYCWKLSNSGQHKSCFTIDEYEYDLTAPDIYIRVCKEMDPLRQLDANINSNRKFPVLEEVKGLSSFISFVISIIFLVATLITYCLFKELRNIPGWNIINLTIALIIAQSCFVIGSLVDYFPLACFIVAVITHYGFLASFLWMHVIAFDLYRNFRKKSSHILLIMVGVRKRLQYYCLVGWIVPLIIIVICLIIDFLKLSSQYSPCYGSYLDGCTFDLNMAILSRLQNFNQSTDIECLKSLQNNTSRLTLSDRYCWLNNGGANLIFFGLPVGLIILGNGIFYVLSIYNIRRTKSRQKRSNMRRFSRVKTPADQDVKFYIQMAFIMGFTMAIGFFLTILSSEQDVLYTILTYTFDLANGSIGVFIFFVFIYRPNVRELYKHLFRKLRRVKKLNKNDKVSMKYNSSKFFDQKCDTVASPGEPRPGIFIVGDKKIEQREEIYPDLKDINILEI